MDDLVKRLKAKRNRPMVKMDLGNGQTISSPALSCFVEDEKLRAEAASEIERLEKRVKELEEEDRKIKQHLKHIREIICEAAKEGFNHNSGDWPEKLFNTNQMSALILDKDSK